MIRIITLILLMATIAFSQQITETEKKIRTIYDTDGRPLYSSQNNKGWHIVQGSATLSSGKATVTLNTSTDNAKIDVSFLADSTYNGRAWSLDTLNINNYWVVPLSATRFMIISDSVSDNSLVKYSVEGQ